MGNYSREFGKNRKNFHKSDCLCVNSGSSALQLVVKLLIFQGGEVITPALTFDDM